MVNLKLLSYYWKNDYKVKPIEINQKLSLNSEIVDLYDFKPRVRHITNLPYWCKIWYSFKPNFDKTHIIKLNSL